MKLSLQPADLRHYIVSLLSTYFPDGLSAHVEIDTINYALERLEYSHSRINKNTIRLTSYRYLIILMLTILPHSFGFLEIRSSSIVMMICYQRNCLISTRLCMV